MLGSLPTVGAITTPDNISMNLESAINKTNAMALGIYLTYAAIILEITGIAWNANIIAQ